ncbi:E3 ubiquitin-protein ligase-like protein [Camelus ferus]|nr:E3 ubiquitin-protein ligase-like protein [Camelus ferus]
MDLNSKVESFDLVEEITSKVIDEILTFETKNPTELAERLRSVCGNQSNAYARLLEYRLNALRGLWNAQRQLALEEQHERESSGDEETLALLKRQGLLQQPEQAPFTSRMGLLLVFPLIQSQSRTDPSLCNITAEVLLNCLRDCQPLSLTKEPADCLNGIETLLCSWLEETSDTGRHIPHKQKENAAAALVALACARGSLKTFVHTVHLLQKQTDLGSLPVADVLYRGFVYCRNEELEPGWVAFGSGSLLHRPVSFDNKPHSLFQVIDQNTLQVCQMVPMPANHLPVGSTMSTVHLSSDGTYFYWIWSPASLNEKTPKGHSVFMDIFELVLENGVFVANPLQERTILMRKEGESAKSINEMLLSRLSRYRASPSATLAALTGSTISNTLKEDQAGACYDTVNNMLWTCSNDYIDQWCNPGNQAFHYVCQRLGVSHIITEPKDEAITTNEVINQLLHHVGAMCIHQLNLLATNPNLPITSVLGKQHPIEAHHLSSICDIMEKAMVNGDTCIIRCILVVFQAASSCLRYLMAVQNHLLSNTILIKPDENDDSDNSLQGETLKELKVSILALATQILTGCDEVLEMLQQVTTALINSDIADREQRLKGLEQVTKATMLGHLLPVLLTSLMHPNLQTLTMADALMPQLVQLVLYTSQTALLLKTQCPLFAEVGCSPCGASDQKGRLFPDERMLEEKEEPGFLTGLKIPAPWAAGKTVETVHPVRDNYKFKETVHIPGARCLYLRFDSRCSSQYDYDKVEGDTVTFSFEMRSGREHNTPDKAMWGFACTVRAQESSEDVSGGLPFLVDLALGLSVLACSMLRILYNGPEITKEEEACQELLRSKLLQRCQWQVEANGVISPALTPSPSPLPLTIEEDREFTYPSDVLVPPVGNYFDLPRIRLPPGIMIKLREISGRARPQFRPSIKEVIQPDVMEEMVVSCVIKHLNLVDALQSLINFQYQEEHAEEYDLLCKIMGETFKKLNAMERQLQSVAELEQKWQSEVDDAMQGKLENNMPFFYDYHFNENKMKELELLCSMKEVSFDGNDLENMVLSLREKFLQEVNSLIQKPSHPLAKTKSLVKSLMNRAELLLHVTIAAQSGLTRSISGTPAETPACKSASETKVISHAVRQPVFLRSMSAPSDLEMIGNEDLEFTRANQRRRHVTSHRSSSFTLLQSLAIEDSRDKPTYSVLLGQLFAFIGTNPDQAVSSSSFLLAAQTRWRRGNTRKQALVHMRELLTAAVRVGGVTHLVGPVTMVLQGGPRIEELTCGGMVEQVQEAFGETMTSVVSLCARYPIACANSIGLLCTIPYTRSEEKCLVRSGLVQLMDRLCSLSSQTESSSSEKQTKKQKVATMAWAAFQVLANRCVEWEKEEGGSTEAVHSGLARQVSSLLTNHLARATECCGNQAAGNDALQDVLSLLNDLSRSHIGKAILSQPACVSKLLSLLLDQRPSPKLVLIILQLCRAALPLMSVEDCGNVELPPWSYSVPSLNSEQEDPSDPASKIASLLLAKLADYVVPGCQTVLSPTASEPDTTLTKTSPKSSLKGDKDPGEESEAVDGKLSIFIHKREDQSSHEVLQPLLSSSEGRPFRLGTGANMEKVVKMDRDMTKGGCCEVITEEAAAALRKATKWAQSGLIVSVGPPVESVNPETVSGLSTGDKKKTAQTSICRERNSELARTDPVRPFISGHVANSMAAEVIALLHSLLMAPESNAAQIWTTTAEKVLSRALMYIPQLGKYAESILENGSSSGRKLAKLQRIARQAVAALCALGGFKETIKIGSEVQLLEDSLFCEEFIQQCPAAVEVLNLVAQECSAGERLAVVEVQCERLRMLYRDCARPPPPPLQADRRQPKEITWSPSRVFPPVRACMFSSHLTSVTFLADPSAGGGLPRGTFIYATSPLPVQAPSFYWEIEVVSYGDTDDDTGPIVSFGFATEAEKRDGAWTNPVGTCLFHNNGRAVHYNGSSLLQWKSVRLDVTLSPGDVAGIGWERTEGTPPPPGQPAKGRVYFTYCGQRLSPYLEDVSGGMWPNTKTRANFGSRPFAYAEGQAHRNAADLCTDLAEEISANFEALPFAMASDSDNDAGTSIASDPGTHGPPCRIAAVATAQQQYDSDTSCHYKVELSYENFITSGPDPHPPPIADDESDDDDDDDIPQEDHYALLVKAWETKVFPTIRRRFRNEAERKSGLDQIKGALQLGMVDIARQTVEFLYEENGGIPRDLYLPTIEDIKDEANKFTIDKVRKGLTVVTRSPDSNNVASSTVGTALPKFAIRGMLKTFGLHGVVLDVDSVNELVQVETYLRSEGVLVRYWYPIDMLERPPAGYRRTATNGLVTLDNTNLQIHRELLRCEAALARLYCRMALLNIFAPKLPHLFTRLFHIPAIRDITLEHLQLLSNQLLAPPLPDGTISSSSILLAQSLQHCVHAQNCSATDLFYQGNSQTVREWLNVAITRTLHQGEESLLELTRQICSFLQTAPEQFPSEEFPISESKVNMDVNFPGAAFVVVSCKESQSGFRKDSSLYKAPWARVLVYGLGHKVKRNGQLNLIEAVCYPRDASPANTGLTPPPTTNQYPSVILSTDKVHIKLGVSPPPGAVLVLHSLPLEFPLAVAFAEQLLSWKSEDGEGRAEDEPDTIPTSVLLQVVELLGNFLWTTDLAACVKELLNPCLAVLTALQSELHKLYDEETQSWGPGCLAVAEVTLPTNMSVTASGTPQSPSLLSKRKKVKMKREKASSSGKRQSARSVDADPAMLNIGGSKPEDMLWKDPQGLGVTSDAIADACQALVGPTAHSRLLVISGIPTHLDEGIVRSAIRKACNAHGGVFKDEIYIPLQDEDPKKPKDKAEGGDGKAEPEKTLSFPGTDSVEAVSDLSADPLPSGLELPIPAGLLEPHVVSSQESLDISLCSTGSLGSLGSLGEPLDNAETASGSDMGSMYTVTSLDNQPLAARPIKGFAVVENCLPCLHSATGEKLVPGAREVLTEIFKSCAHSEQMLSLTPVKPIKVSDIYLSKEQINSQTPGNLLHLFFTNVRPPKKVLEDQLTQILRKYGVPKPKFDKSKYSKAGKEQHPGKVVSTKRPITKPPAKDKAVLNSVSRTALSEKKPTVKPKSPEKSKPDEKDPEKSPTKKQEAVPEEKYLTLEGFHKFVIDRAKQDIRSVWRAILSCGYDLHFERCACIDVRHAHKASRKWTLEMDVALVQYINRLCRHLAITPARLHPHEVYLDPADAADPRVACLLSTWPHGEAFRGPPSALPCGDLPHDGAGGLEELGALYTSIKQILGNTRCEPDVPIESLRLRFALLQSLNTTLETFFLPLVELRQTPMYTHSIAALLKEAKGLIFYDTKVTVMNRVLNATVQRTADHAAPEITLDPLEIVGVTPGLGARCSRLQGRAGEMSGGTGKEEPGEIRASENSYFCQAARQLASVPSSQLCVKLASGGDPTYAFNIRFTGEEVHGTSGSFRHFLWQVCKELQSSSLSLLLLCPSSAVNKSKGKYILTPSPITYGEEQLLHFLGQLLGIAIRADVPLPLDLLPSFWKTLVGEPLDPDQDLQEADILTYNYVKKFESIDDETELEALCAEIASQHLATESPDGPNKPCCRFTYLTMTGEEVELCSRGRHIPVAWENKDIYAAAIRSLRLRELQNVECVTAVRAGLGAIIPLQLLTTLSPLEMELRTCGLPYINLEFLKAHTMYQVGLMETDQHIEFFWGALEMFAQEELCKFIKFACNQERIPFTCPCKDGGPDTAHVPPYPMKIAPPDGTAGSPDSRYIRVETCMFMIKLPQYSSLEIMLEKLRCAIHYREDPLSG